MDQSLTDIRTPPSYCEYAGGACDQLFADTTGVHAVFLYPNEPEFVSKPIEEAVSQLRKTRSDKTWLTWKDVGVQGQIIFCQICKRLRFTQVAFADVSTLNLNLLFEIGYCIGLGIPVIPIRDTSVTTDKRAFDELGLLDTFGYLDYANSTDLCTKILEHVPSPAVISQAPPINREQPLYVIKSTPHTEGMVRLLSALKKSGLYFRTFDPQETTRLSLHDATKQVQSSLGVIVHAVSSERAGSVVQNGRCAFIAGLAMASAKHVLMLQEGTVRQSIDYRDVVVSYTDPSKVPEAVIPLIKEVVESLQSSKFIPTALPLKLLEKVDLGDLAAENEIRALNSYFVPTGQYNEAKRGRAQLVVGRKGAGKTAIFYGVRSTYTSRAHVVLDLKPEGHQFIKLREAVLKELPPGVQQHVLTAFWNYLLLMEIARKIIVDDQKLSYHIPQVRETYIALEEAYGMTEISEQGDFSERLLALVDDIVKRKEVMPSVLGTSQVTQLVYSQDIQPLNTALSEYLSASRKEDIWLLFDNLDKGWPIQAAAREDILLVKSLLEASRKLQRQFENRKIDCHSIIFIRNDIWELLIKDAPDRGKDVAVLLDWTDAAVFKEILRRRFVASTGIDEEFYALWRLLFDAHVKGEESFGYILGRTLMRPRELLRFIRECVDTAVSRGHNKVSEDDILHAEAVCSEDALVDLSFELKDVAPEFADAPYGFDGAPVYLSHDEVRNRLLEGRVNQDHIDRVIDLLLWFGFLGIYTHPDEEKYSYQYQHDLKLMQMRTRPFTYCIHPSFRRVLGSKVI